MKLLQFSSVEYDGVEVTMETSQGWQCVCVCAVCLVMLCLVWSWWCVLFSPLLLYWLSIVTISGNILPLAPSSSSAAMFDLYTERVIVLNRLGVFITRKSCTGTIYHIFLPYTVVRNVCVYEAICQVRALHANCMHALCLAMLLCFGCDLLSQSLQ